jgi:hypothetical protein
VPDNLACYCIEHPEDAAFLADADRIASSASGVDLEQIGETGSEGSIQKVTGGRTD